MTEAVVLGPGSGKTALLVDMFIARSGYATIATDGDIKTREDLWEQLRQSLTEYAAALRMGRKPKKKGRPAKGPAGVLGETAEDVAALIHAAYADLGQPVVHKAVAARLGISPLTLWRWRRAHPEEGL